LMPVRDVIHSSSVSISDARSALVRMEGGIHFPQPVIAACVIASSDRCLPPLLPVAPGSRLDPIRSRFRRCVVRLLVIANDALDRADGENRALPATNSDGNRRSSCGLQGGRRNSGVPCMNGDHSAAIELGRDSTGARAREPTLLFVARHVARRISCPDTGSSLDRRHANA
jgi:hypothetical protein